jgi:hypothetical protein
LLSWEPRLPRRAAASARATVWRAQARQGSGRGRIGDACRGWRTLIPNHYLAPLQQPQGSDSRKEKGRLSRPEKFREGGRAPRVGALSMREEWLTDRKSRTRLPRRCEIANPVLYCLFGGEPIVMMLAHLVEQKKERSGDRRPENERNRKDVQSGAGAARCSRKQECFHIVG